MRKMVRVGAGIFDKQEPEPEPHKNGPAPQHCFLEHIFTEKNFRRKLSEFLLQSGSGSGRFRKSDLDPDKNRPDLQH
jgi:hypothetical protein